MNKTRRQSEEQDVSEANEEMVELFEGRFPPEASHTISVYRKPDDQSPRKKLRYLGNFDMEFLDMEFIQERFGGGSYVLKLLDSRGRWLRQLTVHIA